MSLRTIMKCPVLLFLLVGMSSLANGQLLNPPQKADAPAREAMITQDIIKVGINATEMAELFQKHSGQRVLVPVSVKDEKFSVVIEASPKEPISRNEVADIIRKVAVLENMAFVEHPTDPNILLLAPAKGGRIGCTLGPIVFSESTPLPKTDEVISYVMTLKHIKPDAAVKLLAERRGKAADYQSISAVPKAPAVVITDKTSVIRRMIEYQEEFDQPAKQ